MSFVKGSNKIESFPLKLQKEINNLINDNKSNSYIVEYFHENHGMNLDRQTVAIYKKRYLESFDKKEQPTQEVVAFGDENVAQEVQVILNPKETLQKLMNENYSRLQEIRQMNRRRFDPRWESFINTYTDNIRKMIETFSKLNESLDNDAAKIENIVKSHLARMFKCMYDTIKVVCPEKANQFKEIFSQKYKEEQKQLESKDATNDR